MHPTPIHILTKTHVLETSFCSLLMIWETFPFLHCWQITLHYFHYLRKFLIDVWFVIECEGAWSRFSWKFQIVFLLSSILSNFLHSSCQINSDISNSHLNCKVSLKSCCFFFIYRSKKGEVKVVILKYILILRYVVIIRMNIMTYIQKHCF